MKVKEQLALYDTNPDVFDSVKCQPFLKWPGGKRQLLDTLIKLIPPTYNRYFEPFIGGGALFFKLKPLWGYISDINPDLVNIYEVVRDNVEELIYSLSKHENDEKYFYQIRNVDRTQEYKNWDKIQRASRLLYLNKTCFNGLYRMNSEGNFNVPFGFYTKPKIVDEKNLIACSALLKKTEIVLSSFDNIKTQIQRGDFVYFDPPYVPLNKTSSFTKYYKDDFDEDGHFRLKELCDWLDKKGVKFMLSNSYTKIVRNLYSKYNITIVNANRAINCKAEGRGKIKELIITNY